MKIGDIVKSAVSGRRFMVVPNTKHPETPYWALLDLDEKGVRSLRYAKTGDVRMCDRNRLTPSSLPFGELLKHVVK